MLFNLLISAQSLLQPVTTQIVIPAVSQTSVVTTTTPVVTTTTRVVTTTTRVVTTTTPVVITTRVRAGATIPIPEAPIVEVGGDIDEVGDTTTGPKDLGPSTSSWTCPVPGSKFINDWGQSRSGGRIHTGTDMLAPLGTAILAPLAGTVTFKESSRGGHSLYLKAAGGFQIFGAHLDSYGTAGKVKAGTVIGYVGNSGNASGAAPHLHIEIHPSKGSKTNPYPVLKKICL